MAFVDTYVTTSMLAKCSVLAQFSGIFALIRSLPLYHSLSLLMRRGLLVSLSQDLGLVKTGRMIVGTGQDPGSFAMI